jgi:outer membrane protein TolC
MAKLFQIWGSNLRAEVISLLLLFPCLLPAQPPTRLTLEHAWEMARTNYPLIKQRDLLIKTRDYSVSNASKGYLPALSVNGQATYQSAVTNFPFKIPIPGFTLPTYSKDQYKVYGELDQTIYDGGAIKNQKQSAVVNETIQEQNLDVDLYALFDRVNQLYFGTLLADEQLKQNDLLKKDIQNGLDKVQAQVANGTAYRSSADELSAQLLQTDQSRVELLSLRKAYVSMLGLFVGQSLDDSTLLESPLPPSLADSVARPELRWYEAQKINYDLQDKALQIQLRPKFSAFIQGGYARPGLNFLDNNFQWYYIGGIRLSWNLGALYTMKNQRMINDLGRQTLDIQKETFLFNTRITQRQQSADMVKYTELIKKDDAIIALRESVKNAAGAQLENGVLSAHDFITQVDAEDQARQSLILHRIELLQAQFNYQNTTGNVRMQ